MKALLILATLMAANSAMADGFICTSASGLNVQIYNNTNPQLGTRTASTMVISDPALARGNQTIAKFTNLDETLSSKNLTYKAKVDLRYKNSSRKGELIAGTKLGQLDKILVTVGFSYANPVLHGQYIDGHMRLFKRNGQQLNEDLNCVRYLKN